MVRTMDEIKTKKSGKARKIFSILFVLLLLFSVIFVSGCVGAPASSIKSEREVGEAATNISQNIEGVAEKLREIDEKLG